MAHWALQSSDANPWFFQPHDERLQGIRCTHQLSPWLGDYGQATFLPFNGEPSPAPAQRASSYRAGELKMAPHALKVKLMRYRCVLELTPTERCAAMRTPPSCTSRSRTPRRIWTRPAVRLPR